MSTQTQKRREFLVILYLSSDKSAQLAVSKLGMRTGTDLVSFAAIDCENNLGNWVDPKASVFDAGSAHEVQLIDWLAKNIGRLETLRIVAMVASQQEPVELELIDLSVRKLSEALLRMSVNIRIREFRIACPSYSSEIPKEPFFAQSAQANLVVIARDSSSHQAISRPIEASQTDDYADHIAVELSTVLGMWKEISKPIVDDLAKNTRIQSFGKQP